MQITKIEARVTILSSMPFCARYRSVTRSTADERLPLLPIGPHQPCIGGMAKGSVYTLESARSHGTLLANRRIAGNSPRERRLEIAQGRRSHG